MATSEEDIPPTEPTVAKHGETSAPVATPPDPQTTTPGASLVLDLGKLTKGVIGKYAYWIGALPGAPREHLQIGSIDFPKMEEDVRLDKRGKTKRREQIGSIRRLTLNQLQRVEGDVPQQIIRFDAAGKSPGGPGDGLEVLDEPRRKGTPMRVPTNANVEKAIKDKFPLRPYSAEVTDEPAARYVFMQLCADQERPQRSDFYPKSLEATGLEWPAGTKPEPVLQE